MNAFLKDSRAVVIKAKNELRKQCQNVPMRRKLGGPVHTAGESYPADQGMTPYHKRRQFLDDWVDVEETWKKIAMSQTKT